MRYHPKSAVPLDALHDIMDAKAMGRNLSRCQFGCVSHQSRRRAESGEEWRCHCIAYQAKKCQAKSQAKSSPSPMTDCADWTANKSLGCPYSVSRSCSKRWMPRAKWTAHTSLRYPYSVSRSCSIRCGCLRRRTSVAAALQLPSECCLGSRLPHARFAPENRTE